MIDKKYYYPDEIMEHLTHYDDNNKLVGDAQFACCWGNRTGGKTVGWGATMLQHWEETHEKMILLDKTIKDVDNGSLETWWNKILPIDDVRGIIKPFTERHNITFENGKMFIDEEFFCEALPISNSQWIKKNYMFDHHTNFIMDECAQPGENALYIRGRTAMSRIFEILQTAARGYKDAEKRVHCVFIANMDQLENWVFTDLNMNKFVRNDTKFTVHDGKCFEMVYNPYAKEKLDDSLFGTIMRTSESGKDYYEANNENKPQDNRAFVKSMGLNFKNLQFCIYAKRQLFGVFKTDLGLHISPIEKRNIDNITIYAAEKSEHTQEIKYINNNKLFDTIYALYTEGRVSFQTLHTKAIMIECNIC